MTFVGKVLVVVQVVLSLCFMAFAGAVYTVQQEWKTAYEKKVTELQAKDTQVREREEQISLLNKDLAATQTIQQNIQTYLDNMDQYVADDNVKTQLRTLAQRAQKAEQEVSTLQADLDKVNNMLMVSKENYEKLETANKKVVDEAKERAQESEIFKQNYEDLTQKYALAQDRIFNLEDELFNQETDAKSAADKQKNLLVKVAHLQDVIRREGIDEEKALAKDEPPPLVSGKVLNIKAADRSGPELVEVSIGSNDGLSQGHKLQVFSLKGKGQYLAEIKVVYVEEDRAVGEVVLKTKNGQIQRGDNVTTKL